MLLGAGGEIMSCVFSVDSFFFFWYVFIEEGLLRHSLDWLFEQVLICVSACASTGVGVVGCFATDPQQIRCPTFQLYKHRDVNAEKPTGDRHQEEVVKTDHRHQQQQRQHGRR